MTLIGARLPDALFDAVHNPNVAATYTRRCHTCQTLWTTVEVPFKSHRTTVKANCCLFHPNIRGFVTNLIPPREAAQGKKYAHVLLSALMVGGVYRRRECALNYNLKGGLKEKLRVPQCVDAEGVPTRWSTIEVDPVGRVVDDVTRCPRCRAYGVIQRGGGKRIRPLGRRKKVKIDPGEAVF